MNTPDFFTEVEDAKKRLTDVPARHLAQKVKDLGWHYTSARHVAETAAAELALETGTLPQVGDWPAGVVARYKTVGDATVDITMSIGPEFSDYVPNDRGGQPARHAAVIYTARCQGCGNHSEDHWPDVDVRFVQEHYQQLNDWNGVRPWSQQHAETCRAMPRPDGA